MNKDFKSWWIKTNRLIKKILFFLFAMLIITQGLMINQTAKTFISRTDKLEGESINDSYVFIQRGELEISIENYPSLNTLVFYINGEKVDSPRGRSITLQVKNNDIVEVSGAYFVDTAVLKVTSVSENVAVPELGKLVYVNKNLVMVDRIRLK